VLTVSVCIGGISLDSAMTLVSQLVPRGENEGRTRLTATMLLTSPQVLHGLELSSTSLSAAVDLVTSHSGCAGLANHGGSRFFQTQRRSTYRLARIRRKQSSGSDLWNWGDYSTNQGLNDSSSIYAGTEVVISLSSRNVLLPLLKGRGAVGHAGGMYAIIGPRTFSAAMVNALDLRNELDATLVGEPTGARPNAYSEHGDFVLPNSGLRVSYSTRHYRFGADSATAVDPDRRIEPDWQDFRSGRDPVLDWILAQPIG